jgi:hypothetical protein
MKNQMDANFNWILDAWVSFIAYHGFEYVSLINLSIGIWILLRGCIFRPISKVNSTFFFLLEKRGSNKRLLKEVYWTP